MIYGMNQLNAFYYLDYEISQITSKNTEKERSRVLCDFETNNKIQLLFSVRILDECIDIPTCDSIYITYPSRSKIRTIQRLCRCIRIDKINKFKKGNIYIWCDEYEDILETLSGIKEYDLFFKDKIMINQMNYFNNSDVVEYINDTKLIENYMIGIKEFKQLTWNDKLKLVDKYIVENKKRPSSKDKNKDIKSFGQWVSDQLKNYKNNTKTMKNENIREQWKEFTEKYKEYFMSNDEKWNNNLEFVEKYINDNKKTPSSSDENKDIKVLGQWILNQQQIYKKNVEIMKNEKIRKQWKEFIEKYQEYFMSNDEKWNDNLKLVDKYINDNKKRPSESDKNKDIKSLGYWVSHQLNNYKNKEYNMKNENIREQWEEFIDKYPEYFISNEENWNDHLKLVEKYINDNKKTPSTHDKNKDIKVLGKWLSHQQQNYKKNEYNMTNENIRKQWEEFKENTKNILNH